METVMAETKVPVKQEESPSPSALQKWHPFDSLRQEIDRLFDDFGRGFWRPFGGSPFAREPLFRREVTLPKMPVVAVAESEKAYELTAEMPGIDEK
jgi:HSP20 family protein